MKDQFTDKRHCPSSRGRAGPAAGGTSSFIAMASLEGRGLLSIRRACPEKRQERAVERCGLVPAEEEGLVAEPRTAPS